jgi:hypothetical protein
MRTGTQDKDLGDLDKEDIISDERNGLLNGPVPDIDTLEIGITRKEMGELLNCMNYIFLYIYTQTHTYIHTHTHILIQCVQKLTTKILEVFPSQKLR